MKTSTEEVIEAIIRGDETVRPAERNLLRAFLRGEWREPGKPSEAKDRILRRADAALRLGCSVRAIDAWSRQGILAKVRLPGRTRAAGFRERDVVALIDGKGASA